jgi:type II secretory ATPase GspE/PulE/Tfp pilus assembly ATPase PilB-like protein
MAKGTTSATLSKLLKRAEKITLSDLAVSSRSKKGTPAEVTELVATILAAGIRAGASTIHIEPRVEDVRIRHRIDGVLTEAQLLPRAVAPVLIAGLKLLVHAPVDEEETLPHLAATTVTVQSKPYKLQVATIPVEDGEKAVVQLTSLSGKAPKLQELGYWGPNLKAVSGAITKSRGLVLLAGPHDSGQAESAYSMLNHLSSPQVSIATIEDPITYRISGATQTQVNSKIGLSFPTGLKTLLKQDANVLLVSNIHDTETAKLSVEGALSGRLLLAGVYSNSAASALSYLLAAGIEPYLVAHTVQAVVGQRVVRHLCENCKQIFTPSEQEMIGILKSLGIRTAAQLQRVRELEQQALEEKVVVGASATDQGPITNLYRASKDGCTECSHTGYRGSLGIYEVLETSESIQRLILSSAAAQVIQDQAIQEGMPTMQMDGLVKILLGLTSVDEVASATEV